MCYSEMEETIATELSGSWLYTLAQYQGNPMEYLEGWNQYSIKKPSFGSNVVVYLPAKSRYHFAILYQDDQGKEFWLDNRGFFHAASKYDIWMEYPLKVET